MSKIGHFVAITVIGVVAGFIGGAFAGLMFARRSDVQKPAEVIRAKRFEAIGENGVVRARFGLDGGDVPVMRFLGPDEKERLTMMLDNTNEPLVMMEDTKGNLRVVFGHETSDTSNPGDDDWSLSFRAPGEGDFSAALGVLKSYQPAPSHKYRGFVGMRDVKGKWHSLRRE